MRKPYPSDLTDEQWAIIQPLIPVYKVDPPRVKDMREVLNAIFHLNRAGCQWGMLPHDLPPKSTVHSHFAQWRNDGSWQNILDALRQQVRVAVGREPSPSAGSTDSQTVKGTDVGGAPGYDGGKKVNGLKRHIVVMVFSAASADDGTFAPEVLSQLTAEHQTRLKLIWANSKYRNYRLDGWLVASCAGYRVEVVRSIGSKGYVKLPRH